MPNSWGVRTPPEALIPMSQHSYVIATFIALIVILDAENVCGATTSYATR